MKTSAKRADEGLNPDAVTQENPPPKRVFKFLATFGDKMGTKQKYIHYRPPELKMEGKKWYVEYYYRVPAILYHRYMKPWERFKVYEDINRFKDLKYAETLRHAVEHALEGGFNPFEKELEDLETNTKPLIEKKKQWTIQQAILFWEEEKRDQGDIKQSTLDNYFKVSQTFLQWLIKANMQNLPASAMSENVIELYLKKTKEERKLSNRSYNNELETIQMIFRFLAKKKMTTENPTTDVNRKRTKAKKHKAYDARTLERIVTVMKERDPLIYFAFQVVYHLCIRSGKELRALRVGNIMPDRMQVFLPAEDTKMNADRYIPMSEAILKIFKERGVLDYPPDYYVFSLPKRKVFYPDGNPGPNKVGENFFAVRFANLREPAGLSMDNSLYAAKHTRVIDLKTDGVSDADIMALTGHTDFTSYSQYLRDLGISFDAERLSKATRNI